MQSISKKTLMWLSVAVILIAGQWGVCRAASQEPAADSKALVAQSVGVLREAMATQKQWKKVHAAEALIELDYPQEIAEEFQFELDKSGNEKFYRIGIWRVSARLANGNSQRGKWVGKIVETFKNSKSPDRLHAIETLGKLGYKGDAEFIEVAKEFTKSTTEPGKAYTYGVLVNSGQDEYQDLLINMLTSSDGVTGGTAAYILKYVKSLTPENRDRLIEVARGELLPDAKPYIVSAACFVAGDADVEDLKDILRTYARSKNADYAYEALQTLGACGTDEDIPLLKSFFGHKNPDVRIGASYAVLRILRRQPITMANLDWGVVILYAIGMVVVGYVYSKKMKKADDYLLGGRNMKPWAVGLSLFATLLSTLSYLAMPGEVVKYGPMVMATFLSYPLIFFVVGYFLIPFIMKLKITSAYELLELRLGISVRMLGTFFFLSLRLLWMAMIIFVTTDIILLPMMGIPAKYLPLVCAIIGLVTVTYTSMGGLKAVVFTDVVQSFILFFGAILSVVLISSSLGGVGEWFPTQWEPHWDKLNFNLDPDARFTVGNAIMMTFLWFVCTMGSDQMAIQRYLATKDVKAARKTLAMSLSSGIVVNIFLGILGFALFGYFAANPQLIPDGQTMYEGADNLFPRFVVVGLPVGVTGLVVAGLLAAAMSSLSSGMNSSGSVVVVDFIDRFRHKPLTEKQHVRTAKIVSLAVGTIVVLLSLVVGQTEGNLFEIINKVVNLFVGPLFVLFFMAMFIPWANSFGTLMGAVCSVAISVAIAFFGFLGLSFIWILPGALVVGIGVGMIFSLIGPRKRRCCE